MASIQKRENGKWRARYRCSDPSCDKSSEHEHARHFDRKIDAQRWLDEHTAALVAGTFIAPSRAKITLGEWAETWLKGYETNRPSTVRQARVHVKVIVEGLGSRPMRDIRSSEIKRWIVTLQTKYAPSTVYALYRRLAHILSDAVDDKLLTVSPVTRKNAPPMAKQRAYVATTEQVWALHDALPEHFRPVVLLGAFAGLRVSEIAALRVTDVDFMRGIITPEIQYPSEPLKTEMSKTPIPIPAELALELSKVPTTWGSPTLVVGAYGRPVSPYTIETAFAAARVTVDGLPAGFRIHDLRHYFASLLIAAGLDIKTVQARLRHASAKTTLDTYGHLWPDRDESSKAAVLSAFADRTAADSAAV